MIDLSLVKFTWLHSAFCIMWLATFLHPLATWGNVLDYSGNINSYGAALSVGTGASASVLVNIGFKMPIVVPIKLQDSQISSIEGKAYNAGPGRPYSIRIHPLKLGLKKDTVQLTNENQETAELLLVNSEIQAINQQNISKFKFQGKVLKSKSQVGSYQGEAIISLTSL